MYIGEAEVGDHEIPVWDWTLSSGSAYLNIFVGFSWANANRHPYASMRMRIPKISNAIHNSMKGEANGKIFYYYGYGLLKSHYLTIYGHGQCIKTFVAFFNGTNNFAICGI